MKTIKATVTRTLTFRQEAEIVFEVPEFTYDSTCKDVALALVDRNEDANGSIYWEDIGIPSVDGKRCVGLKTEIIEQPVNS